MYIAIYIIAAVVVLFILLAAIAPKKYESNRSIVINRPLGEVFQYLKYVKNQDYWSPWKERDPNMKQTFTGQDGTVGFISAWESDHKQVGSGEQEIVNIVENEKIETELRFLKPWKSVSQGYIKVADEGNNQTKVVWGFYGDAKLPMSIFMLFMNMDKAVGKDFEEGLAKLKTILEK
ncbi:MAG TPA: polyketide cyclase [Flavobacteriaceae bacterium]|nr:polyketide cyclase [Flavobacteriaceae bacterium]HAT65965.1 polyketide cyclase [Flavobacteriaceae bacterium]|tara:strand:- start:10178 stop:10708 length:531 start_codon:yes stop_codon:yes gene_type:complete